jgi:hypothetical protein
MSVINTYERITSGQQSDTIDSKTGITQTIFHRIFVVETDNNSDGPDVILQNGHGVPYMRQPHTTLPGFFAYDRETKRLSNRHWEVDVQYANQIPDSLGTGQPGQPGPDPTKLLPKVSWGYEEKKKILSVQWDKKTQNSIFDPITNQQVAANIVSFTARGAVNSAGEPFTDPPIYYTTYLATLNIERYEPVIAPGFFFSNEGRVNNDTFYGAAPFKVRCWITGTREFINGQNLMLMKYRFLFDEDGHNPSTIDAGTFYLDTNGKQTAFTDKDGNPRRGLLNGLGHPLATGTNPMYLMFPVIKSTPFGLMNIPNYF